MSNGWLDDIKWTEDGLVPVIVQETGTGKAITTDGDALGNAIGIQCNGMRQFVEQPAGTGHQPAGTRPVQLAGQDILNRATDIGGLECARHNGTDRCRPDEGLAQ